MGVQTRYLSSRFQFHKRTLPRKLRRHTLARLLLSPHSPRNIQNKKPSLTMRNSFVFLIAFFGVVVLSSELNPPRWPGTVYVCDPSNPSGCQSAVNHAYSVNGGENPGNHGQFNPERYAFLFKPGSHNVNVNVGYYTSIIGTGLSPKDTQINSVTCEEGSYDSHHGALSTFWRSGENFYTRPSKRWNGQGSASMLWAVSQASPLRRVYVDGNLDLWENGGWSSGGYLGDSVVTGTIYSGSQQQWFTKNTQMGGWNGGNWNMVFTGCSGHPPGSKCSPYVNVGSSPIVAAKPFISIGSDGKYTLVIPAIERDLKGPPDYSNAGARKVGFEGVYVASEGDSAATINGKINQGLHIIFSPGIYNLTDTIVVTKPNLALIGIGFPTFVPTTGKPCFQIENVDGVRFGGVLLQAGSKKTSSLINWGYKGYGGNSSNPSFMYDMFARVGGPNNQHSYQVYATDMVVVNSGNVVIDGTWFWRADHGVGGEVYNGDNPVETGLVVNGDDVIIYGLAVEHTLGDMVVWNGERGKVFFYQSEMPYDANTDYDSKVSFRLHSSVQEFEGYGIGVYSYFRDHNVWVNSGISTGNSENIHFEQAFTVFLNGQGGIKHVINNVGNSVGHAGNRAYVCQFNPNGDDFDWQNGSHCIWAEGCDFQGHDITHMRSSGADCSDKCYEYGSSCTNFAWNEYQGGTCWLKNGDEGKSDAISNNSNGQLCGIMNGR